MKAKITKDDFLQIAMTVAKFSDGKIQVDFEDDAHFLKLNGRRIGRDMEVYEFLALLDSEFAFLDFLELLLSIRKECPKSYIKASVQLKFIKDYQIW